MKKLYTGIKTRITSEVPTVLYIGMWNGQVERLREGHPKQLDFRKPAVFIQLIPSAVDSVGGGVQVFDPLQIKIHIVHELLHDPESASDLNLAVFDQADLIHAALQDYSVRSTNEKYGSSAFNRTEVEVDDSHDMIYHMILTYTTTWTDNSTINPRGGYEADPPFYPQFTETVIAPLTPSVVASVSNIAFGDVVVGESAIETFTISATNILNAVILSSSNPAFTISVDNSVFSSRIEFPPVDNALTLTTVYVKFAPDQVGAYEGDLNFGIPGINQVITMTGNGT